MRRFVLTAVLTACMLFLVAMHATAKTETATITLYPGENWIAAPLVPIDPSPQKVFAGFTGTIARFNSPNQCIISSSQADFGNILLGDGYKITNTSQNIVTINYEGVPDGVPDSNGNMSSMWIALQGNCIDDIDAGSMHWVGQPFNHNTLIENIYVTGIFENTGYTIREAINLGLIDPLWRGFNNETKEYFTAGLPEFGADENFLRAGSMYEIVSHKDLLAFIIPADVYVPEPSSVVALIYGVGALTCMFLKRQSSK